MKLVLLDDLLVGGYWLGDGWGCFLSYGLSVNVITGSSLSLSPRSHVATIVFSGYACTWLWVAFPGICMMVMCIDEHHSRAFLLVSLKFSRVRTVFCGSWSVLFCGEAFLPI